MTITLEKADISDAREIYDLQIESFKALLNKYQDFDYSPGAEKPERTVQRLMEPITDFYFISLDGKHIGALRVCDFDRMCKLKQIFILPQYQGHGYAQKAIIMAETRYPGAVRWELDTILQEESYAIYTKKWVIKRPVRPYVLRTEWILCFMPKEKILKAADKAAFIAV